VTRRFLRAHGELTATQRPLRWLTPHLHLLRAASQRCCARTHAESRSSRRRGSRRFWLHLDVRRCTRHAALRPTLTSPQLDQPVKKRAGAVVSPVAHTPRVSSCRPPRSCTPLRRRASVVAPLRAGAAAAAAQYDARAAPRACTARRRALVCASTEASGGQGPDGGEAGACAAWHAPPSLTSRLLRAHVRHAAQTRA
jgi:hypothetical protein